MSRQKDLDSASALAIGTVLLRESSSDRSTRCAMRGAPGSPARRGGGEQVVGIAGIRHVGRARAQQSFDLLGRCLDHAARPASLELTSELDERLIGVVQAPRQDGCNVKQRDRVDPQEGGGIGDIKLRDLQRTHVRAG